MGSTSFATTTLTHLLLLAILSTTALAHMHLRVPKPLGFDRDGPTTYDWWVGRLGGASHMGAYPCRGKLTLFDAEPVQTTWTAGTTARFSLGGSSPHYGGSCQVSLSYDRGVTFRVMKSWSGACPKRTNAQGQDFDFPVPMDAPPGVVLFAWSWFNREQEFYHNCAKVEIRAGSAGPGKGLDALPLAVVADVPNGCLTPLTRAETLFERPGPAHVVDRSGEYPLLPPTGGERCYSNPPGMAQPKAGGSAPAVVPNPNTPTTGQQTGGEVPQTGGEIPKAGGEIPKAGGEIPKAGGEIPKAGGEIPKTGGDIPKTGGEIPQTGGEVPKTGGENPGSKPGFEFPKPPAGGPPTGGPPTGGPPGGYYGGNPEGQNEGGHGKPWGNGHGYGGGKWKGRGRGGPPRGRKDRRSHAQARREAVRSRRAAARRA